ncbi:lipopolysaccharide export system permease protein [Desulfobaculum xiamenense]|uniref:Lipopolysaccharide export system permease protein n=1 Tax=Desulfobaculum xiamenense TaxID=995050 RepID=A0A846QEZ6_9BACT|nr:LptF/LptG family permease [Desulfobaculum xiamenense]NJB66831.1 lipopolysaccharide export system permease protein [Desulfobaculum xiamenense]
MFARTLHTYLLRQNLFYLMTCLGVGAGLYLMTDIFDRLDDFIEAGLGFSTVALYFTVKLPLIISQILPAVFLLSVVAQLCLMARHRELLALRAGGISFGRLSSFYIAYALAWCVIQLVFSQFVGVYGQQTSSHIWSEQVRGNIAENTVLRNLWFKDGDHIVEMERAYPLRHEAEGVTIYELAPDRGSMVRVYSAQRAEVRQGHWLLHEARVLDPQTFSKETRPELELALSQDIATFLVIDPDTDPAQLPLRQLSQVIDRLEVSGSNVEGLRTAWHSKWAYAFSILTMSILAMAMVTIFENIYLNIGLSLVLTFAYYAVFMIGQTLGQGGLMHPAIGAWLGNIVFCLLGGARLAWCALPTRKEH